MTAEMIFIIIVVGIVCLTVFLTVAAHSAIKYGLMYGHKHKQYNDKGEPTGTYLDNLFGSNNKRPIVKEEAEKTA